MGAREWKLVLHFCASFIVTFSSVVLNVTWSSLVVGGIDAGHTMFSPVGSALALIPGLVLIPIIGIFKTVMYFNLRVEKEGLDAHVLSRDLGGGAYINPFVAGDEETEVV